MRNFIRLAENTPGGFDDIWLLGDVFGHSWESTGVEDLSRDVLEALSLLTEKTALAVMGNWEYWLSHPERDLSDKDQGKYTEQLNQRRQMLSDQKMGRLLDLLAENVVQTYPAQGEGEFTLFHGCSYPTHGNSSYQPHPSECYLFPRDLNTVTRGLFGNPENLGTPHFLFGHTHTPGFFTYAVGSMNNMWQYFTDNLKNKPVFYGGESLRYGINPGSAGIAGKKMPRTAVLLDTDRKTFTYLVDEERQTL